MTYHFNCQSQLENEVCGWYGEDEKPTMRCHRCGALLSMVAFPRKLEQLFKPWRYKNMESGRGCGKSWSVADALLLIAADPKMLGRTHTRMSIGCGRETMRSIKDSVHKLLKERIDAIGMQDEYEVQQSVIINRNNGSDFMFTGLRYGIMDLKSLEGIDIFWGEEAQQFSYHSLEILRPTIRKPGSEIWFTWNPVLTTDPIYQEFVLKKPPRMWHVHLTQEDNPWFTGELIEESDAMKEQDPAKWAHVYGGQTKSSLEGAVYKDEMERVDIEGRICDVPYDANYPVLVIWDIGYDDAMSLWFLQIVNGQYRFIDHMEEVHKTPNWFLIKMQEKGYNLGTFWVPWDAAKIYKKFGSGMSTHEILIKAGHEPRTVPDIGLSDGIFAAKSIFPRCAFDRTRCIDGVHSLRTYVWEKAKLGDDAMVKKPSGRDAVVALKRQPEHNDASHAADAFRYAGVAISRMEKSVIKTPEQERRIIIGQGRGDYAPYI